MEGKLRLRNAFKNEFNEVEGTAFFPYFDKEITVISREGVSSEYTEKCLENLEEIDESLIFQICKYAEFYLKDILLAKQRFSIFTGAATGRKTRESSVW